MLIFKICEHKEWQQAVAANSYSGSADDVRDGFIHLSSVQQLAGTAAKHFAGRDDLVLVAFDTEDLADSLRWEASRGGQEFPHVYGVLTPAAARWTKPLPLGLDGHDFPDLDEA